MANDKKANTAAVSCSTENINLKFNGTISACTIQLFDYIMAGANGKTAADIREQALRIMQQRHKELVAEGR